MDPKDEIIAGLRCRVAELENTVKLRDLEIQELNKRVEQSKPGYVINRSTPFPVLRITHEDFKKVLTKLAPVAYVRLFRANHAVHDILDKTHPTLRKNIGKDINFNLSQISSGWTFNMGGVMLPLMDERFKEKFCKTRRGFRFQNVVFASPGIQEDQLPQLIETARSAMQCFGENDITCDTLNTNGMASLQEMFDVLKPNYYRANGMIPGLPLFQNLSVKGVKHISLGGALAPADIHAVLDEKIFEDCHDIHLELVPSKTPGIFDKICHFMKRLQLSKKSKSIQAVGSILPDWTPAVHFRNTAEFMVSRTNGFAWFFMLHAEPGAVVTYVSFSTPYFLALLCRYCKNWEDFMTHFGGNVGTRKEEIREEFFPE